MKMKLLRIVLSILGVILVLASFPVRDVLGYRDISDILRIAGFILIIVNYFLRWLPKK